MKPVKSHSQENVGLNMSNRKDSQGFDTKVTFLGKGYGVRVLRNGKVVSEATAPTKLQIGSTIKDMLRMIDKCGNPSEMASSSRDRRKTA